MLNQNGLHHKRKLKENETFRLLESTREAYENAILVHLRYISLPWQPYC